MASSSSEHRMESWESFKQNLMRYAIPDPRFHYSFSLFTPDFTGSSMAINRLRALPCYQEAAGIFVAPDNSLERLRLWALQDGKRLLVSTCHLRRGFVLLDPRRIPEDKYELASSLDFMERPGIGRHVTLAQLQEEGIKLDMFVLGSRAVNQNRVEVWKHPLSKIRWCLLVDRNILSADAPIVTVQHPCQIVDVTQPEHVGCGDQEGMEFDWVFLPGYEIHGIRAKRPKLAPSWLDDLDSKQVESIPPLQELKGIKMMERIMQGAGFVHDNHSVVPNMPQADQQLGFDMVERIMNGHRS